MRGLMKKLQYNDFKYLDFHDSYFIKTEVDGGRLVWVLEAVNVSSECALNPFGCSMMASEMRVEFADAIILQGCRTDFLRLAEESFDIISAEELKDEDNRHIFRFCMQQGIGEYIELEISFTGITFEWEKYVAKAWYVYSEEKNCVKQFILNNPNIDWMVLDSRQGGKMAKELHRELCKTHPLYGIEAMAYAKSEANDDVLFSMDNGKCVIVHLTYSKEDTGEYPRFIEFYDIESALKYILNGG